MAELNAYGCHQNVTEPQATEYQKRKYMCVHELWARPCSTSCRWKRHGQM